MKIARLLLLVSLFVFLVPIAVRAALYWAKGDDSHWSRADWSSTGALPDPQAHEPAMVRVYSSRVGRWRSIFATHSWIVVKERGATSYQRFDKVGWGSPIRVNGYAPDGRWFGNDIEPVFSADGPEAEMLIPRILAAVDAYAYRNRGDYNAWPGPNSNTFVASVLAAVPDAPRSPAADGAWQGFPDQWGVGWSCALADGGSLHARRLRWRDCRMGRGLGSQFPWPRRRPRPAQPRDKNPGLRARGPVTGASSGARRLVKG